ncbi:MAG: hypothetical protein L0Y54_03445 [Sporichthyaceae bacterium]|nr:hypothetical protein [Sporichthyaceae bacterium]
MHVELTQTTEIAVELDPAAAITATVIERDTQVPNVFACVMALPLRVGGIGQNDCTHRTDNDGNVLIGELEPGTYTLLVVPNFGYGMQWVGESGGTGSQYDAVRLDLVNGQSVAMGQIEVDPAVTITGHIRDAKTNQIAFACGSVLPVSGSSFNPALGGIGCSGTAADGLGYEITDVGPYDWPVEFVDTSNGAPYAWVWSGGAADRLAADLIPAREGQPGIADIRLKPGGRLMGTVRDETGASYDDFVDIHPFNTRTGDYAGQVGSGVFGSYEMPFTLTSQDVKLQLLTVGRPVSWYDFESSFETADVVR